MPKIPTTRATEPMPVQRFPRGSLEMFGQPWREIERAGKEIAAVGHALTEAFIVENGIPFTDRLARYRMPNITQTPEITSFIVEHPTAEGPYGAKGVGEIVSIPTIPAITNAIYHAVGVRIDRIPVDQELILKELSHK